MAVQAELTPGPDLEQLLERSQSPRKPDERLRQLGHGGLSLVHRLDDLETCEALMGDLPLHEESGNHPGDLAPGFERRIGEDAHEPDVTGSVDQVDRTLGERSPERTGSLRVPSVPPGLSATEDTDGFHGDEVGAFWRAGNTDGAPSLDNRTREVELR